MIVEPYQGCEECKPRRFRKGVGKGVVGFLACAFASVCAAVSKTVPFSPVSDTRLNPIYHIVEEPGKVDLMAEELPTDYYYEKSRERLTKRFPEVQYMSWTALRP